MSHVEKSHFDPVTHFQWQMTKTGLECVTVSTDGYAHFFESAKNQAKFFEHLKISFLQYNVV